MLAQLTESVERLEHQARTRVRSARGRRRPIGDDLRQQLDGSTRDLWRWPALSCRVTRHRAWRALRGRRCLTDAAQRARPPVAGFEAGAVMGATQAAWTRLEQRLDAEFDDLGRQLQAMVALIERTATIAEAVANRPVLTGDQLRRAASAMKESVASAGRSRRDRRGGQRGLGSGT